MLGTFGLDFFLGIESNWGLCLRARDTAAGLVGAGGDFGRYKLVPRRFSEQAYPELNWHLIT